MQGAKAWLDREASALDHPRTFGGFRRVGISTIRESSMRPQWAVGLLQLERFALMASTASKFIGPPVSGPRTPGALLSATIQALCPREREASPAHGTPVTDEVWSRRGHAYGLGLDAGLRSSRSLTEGDTQFSTEVSRPIKRSSVPSPSRQPSHTQLGSQGKHQRLGRDTAKCGVARTTVEAPIVAEAFDPMEFTLGTSLSLPQNKRLSDFK